jgi:hypothetical protein
MNWIGDLILNPYWAMIIIGILITVLYYSCYFIYVIYKKVILNYD